MKAGFCLLAIAAMLIIANYSYSQDNLMKNGGFEDGVLAPWSTYNDGVKTEIIKTGAFEGKNYLKVITVKGANFWDAGLQHNAGNYTFVKGKKYTLATFLRSPNKLQINFKPELGAAPWTGFGEKAFTMTETWTEYSITTPVFANDVKPGTITFHIAYNAGEFHIDGGRFFEGDYVAPPAPKPASVQSESKLSTAWGKLKAE